MTRRGCAPRWTASSPPPTVPAERQRAFLFSEAADEAAAARDLLGRGLRAVVVKHGAAGATLHAAAGITCSPGFAATEIDPTGAGDTFAAHLRHLLAAPPAGAEKLRLANAAGALAVGRRGPMEGASTEAEIAAFLARQPEARA